MASWARWGFSSAAVAFTALALQASSAHATLQLLQPDPAVPATFRGQGGYSSDGLGQNGTDPAGTVQAEVPAGSTVVRAYLYGTYFSAPDPTDAQRTINFDGTDVLLAKLPNSEPGAAGLSTARAEVTSQVAAKVGGGGGITEFAINSDPANLDGVALVVIFSNPALPAVTIGVLDGGSKPEGDTVTLDFAAPIDPAAPGFATTLALGSGFSFQGSAGHVCGGGSQRSTVDVNGKRLTSCAGNFDDGLGNNGALITVGGVGDSTNNPADPNATDSGEDDELYNLVPFLSAGQTSLTLQTANPSADDNLFLAVVSTTAEARVTTEVCDDGRDNDGDGLVDGADPDCQPLPPPDTGGDGVTGPSPTPETPVEDTDGDGVPDIRDICPTVAAPGTLDGCPPRPVLGVTATVRPLAGEVFVGVPVAARAGGGAGASQIKGVRFVPLREARSIPVGSFLDTRRGIVRLRTARTTPGRSQSGDFFAGVFQVLQSRRRAARGLTELRLRGSSFRRCGRASASRLTRRALRRLAGRARGRFRTRGRYSAATVRGTEWAHIDTCDGTLTRVRRGSVVVRDFRLRRNVLVRAGKSYLARPAR